MLMVAFGDEDDTPAKTTETNETTANAPAPKTPAVGDGPVEAEVEYSGKGRNVDRIGKKGL